MCIVADQVKSVSKTKIASFMIKAGWDQSEKEIYQLVIYSANIDSVVNKNALILPVYNPGNNPNKIIPLDLSEMSDFFDKLDALYNRSNNSKSFGVTYSSNSISLPVYRVGNYKFSIMPSKEDFVRLNTSELIVDPAARVSIDVHSNDYSFIVYQFYQKGNIDITPFGYLCKPYKDHQMIIPTIHGHPDNCIAFNSRYIDRNIFEDVSEYDHVIYTLIDKSDGQKNDPEFIPKVAKLLSKIKKDYLGRSIAMAIPKSYTKKVITLKDTYKNRNIRNDISGFLFMNDLEF